MAFGVLSARDPKQRLLLKLFLIVLVHVALIFLGNENATPAKLLGSFVLSSTLIIISDRVRAKIAAPPPPPTSAP